MTKLSKAQEKKDEKYIKSVLEKVFKSVGNFQQTEFNSGGGSSRRDFVILGDDYFHYYEIKTEKDSFVRLPSQISNAVGLFTKMYIVAPMEKVWKLTESGIAVGLIMIEDLEEGITNPRQEQKYDWKLSINKVMETLWADDLREYIKRRDTNFKRLTKTVDILQKEFLELYSDKDCLKILNEVLPKRDYNFRRYNRQLKEND